MLPSRASFPEWDSVATPAAWLPHAPRRRRRVIWRLKGAKFRSAQALELVQSAAVSSRMVGAAHALTETFGSTAHGAGRIMSRAQAKRRVWGETLFEQVAARGIVVRAASKSGVAEEVGFAYKDLDEVVDVVHRLGISRKVSSLTPMGNIKG